MPPAVARGFFSPSAAAAVFLFLTGFGMAVFFHGTQDPLYAPQILCFLLMGLTLLAPGLRQGWDVPRGGVVCFIGAHWLYLLIALQWSTAPYISTYFFFIFSISDFVFFALILSQDRAKICAAHAGVLVAALAALALWALAQFLFFYQQYGPRIHHPLLDPNSLAGLMNLGLLPALAFFMAADERRQRILSGALSCLFYAALLVTQSRGGLMAAALAAFVMLPFLSRPWQRKRRKLLVLLGCGLLIPCALWLFSDVFYARDMTKVFLGGGAGSMIDRIALWGSTWEMIRDHFWTGTGLATFSYYYGAYRLPVDRSDGFFAHMDPLQFWAEMGIIAPVLFYAMLTAILLRTIKTLNKTDANEPLQCAKILGPFCGLLAVTLHAHLNYHLYMPALRIPMAVLLAYWYVATEDVFGNCRVKLIPQKPLPRYALAVGVCIALGFAAIWSTGAAVSTYYLTKAERHLSLSQLNDARRDVTMATRWSPRSKPQIPQYEARWRTIKLFLQDGSMDDAQKHRLYEEALVFLDEAQRRQPNLSTLRDGRARLYFIAQQQGLITDGYEKAIAEWRGVLQADPINIDARMNLSSVYLKQGEMKKALAVLEDGLRWPRPKGQADLNFLVTTARLRQQIGDQAGYDQLINEALARAKSYGLTRPAHK